jgi:hypothetical protein
MAVEATNCREKCVKIHGPFFIRGTLRTEENQFLAVPRSKVLNMSNKMLSLLGYKKPSTVLGIIENQDPSLVLRAVFDMEHKSKSQKRDSVIQHEAAAAV